jgi:hypothetical protein
MQPPMNADERRSIQDPEYGISPNSCSPNFFHKISNAPQAQAKRDVCFSYRRVSAFIGG